MTLRSLALASVAAALVACGTDASCPRDLPDTCPSPAPSYQGQIEGLINTYCVGCHSATGQVPDRPLDSYQNVFSRRATVLNLTYTCSMPPPDFPQPTESERVAILSWLVCGAPNN